MPRINLLPWRDQQRRERKLAFFVALGGAAALAAVAAFIAYLLFGSMIDAQEHAQRAAARARSRCSTSRSRRSTISKRRSRSSSRACRSSRSCSARGPRSCTCSTSWSRTMPDGTYLTSVKQTGTKLKLDGVAQSSTRVSALMRNISASQWLRNPELEVVETKTDTARQQLRARCRAGEPARATDDAGAAQAAGATPPAPGAAK